MRQVRYSLGLLELASGLCSLLLALCITLVQSYDIYPPLGFLSGFIAAPLLFWLVSKVQERLPKGSRLASYSFSRPATLFGFGVILLLTVVQSLFIPSSQNGGPLAVAGYVSGGIILLRGTGPRVAYLVAFTLLLSLGISLVAPPSHATALFCTIVGIVLIPVGVVTLRCELPG